MVVVFGASDEPGGARHGTEVASVLASPDRLRGARIYVANVFGQAEALRLVAGADALMRAIDWLASEDVRFVNLRAGRARQQAAGPGGDLRGGAA